MPTRQNTNFPRLKSDEEFEDLILDLCRLEWNDPLASDRHGRSGQGQDGVDIFGHPNGESDVHYGAQCKLRTGDKQPTKNDIEKEVGLAKEFAPALKILVVVTDAPRDVNTQEIIRLISNQETQIGGFSVTIWFWDSICQRIEAHPALIIKYFRDYFNILTTAPEAELLANIPLHVLSFHYEVNDPKTLLDEALEVRGIQVDFYQGLINNTKLSPDGLLFQYYGNDKLKLRRFAGLVLKHSNHDCPVFIILLSDLHEEFLDLFEGMGGALNNIQFLNSLSLTNQLASNIFGIVFKYGYRRRGSLTTLDLSIRSAPIHAHKAFLDINWSSKMGPPQIPTKESWETTLLPAIEDIQREIGALGETILIQIRPILQLPAAFTWGFIFNIRLSRIAVWARETGMSELEMQRWVSDSSCDPMELSQKWFIPLRKESRSIIIELSNGQDIHSSVSDYLIQAGLAIDAWTQIGCENTDSRFRNIDQDCAVAFAESVGQTIRSICQSGVTDIHLFLKMPSPLAILVGQRLQACGRIHLYWYVNPSYQFAFTVS